MHLDLVTVVVADYDDAITFFVDVLGFELAEDSPATTNDGRLKRWVVVRPPGGGTGLLLAEADGSHRARAIGSQARRPRLLLPARRRPRAHVRALDAGPVMAAREGVAGVRRGAPLRQ
jgi:catechol 2,3-dioxygenase-like lactoylglutathione lyase family enzyme